MTVDILFMAKNKLALRVNMCFSNLHGKIFCELPKEDQKKWIFDFDGDVVMIKYILIKGLSKKFGTHPFVMVIFQL